MATLEEVWPPMAINVPALLIEKVRGYQLCELTASAYEMAPVVLSML